VERLQEPQVAAVHVAEQVHDGVGLGRSVLVGFQERHRAQRDIGRQRGDTGRVDQRVRAEPATGYLHLQVLHLLGRATQVDPDRPGPAGERAPLRPAVGEVHHHPVRGAVAVPGHDAGALPRVRGGQLFADHGVEQGRLASLDLACDSDPEWFVEAGEGGRQPVVRRAVGDLAPRPDQKTAYPVE
jgi:hypothetical protein